jgi:hypothetical protein
MWYAARLILKCTVGNQISDFLYDEQVRLIKADTADEAYSKALQLGREEESDYQNNEKERVRWSFEGLFDLDRIDKLEDGAEITSKRFRANSSHSLVVSKQQLSVYFSQANDEKTVKEILEGRSEE